jgi:hypothetical protein
VVTLKRLLITVALASSSNDVTDLRVSFEAPLELDLVASQALVPADTAVHTCSKVEGLPWRGTDKTHDPAIVTYEPSVERFDLQAVLPLSLRGIDEACSKQDWWLRVTAQGDLAQ